MQGDVRAAPPLVRAALGRTIEHGTGRLEFVRATLDEHEGAARVHPLKSKASGSVVSMAHADAYVLLDPEQRAREGELVSVLRLRDV